MEKKLLSLKMATMTSLPLPVSLVSSVGPDNVPNILVITYITGVNEEPPMFGIAIRPQKFSHRLIKSTGEFVINIPTAKLLKEIDFCGTFSGKNVHKFNYLGLTPLKARCIRVPIIAECPINIECRVKQIIHLPSHDFFIGEAVALHIDRDIVCRRKNQYGLLLPDFSCLSFLFTTFLDYRVVGPKVGTAFQEHKKPPKEIICR